MTAIWTTPCTAIVTALLAGAAFADDAVLAIESRPGVKEILIVTPSATLDAAQVTRAVLVFNGGGGGISLATREGRLAIGGGFPIRERQALADAVGAVAILAPPSDRLAMDLDWRETREHVADVAAAIAVLHQRFPAARVWLLGLSNGALSAAHAAAALEPQMGASTTSNARLGGVILLSAAELAFKTEGFSALTAPVLVVHHRRDSCLEYRDIEARARWYALVTVDDTRLPKPGMRGRDCGAESAHVFAGKEEPVLRAIEQWINTGAVSSRID